MQEAGDLIRHYQGPKLPLREEAWVKIEAAKGSKCCAELAPQSEAVVLHTDEQQI